MISIPLNDMTLQDKLLAIELLWGSISKESTDEISPVWHKNELERRMATVNKKESTFEDWDAVKQELQDLIH
ncbi:MAG: addiction module protein [Trichlorobacter sp.]|nr:addiction module protein [Trichlorobacter sp.]